MSGSRFLAVFGLELRQLLRRPMFWTMVGVLALLAWGMSTGSVMLGTGSALVGGRKAWITSEFSAAFILSVLAAAFYAFFLAIASGLSVPRDLARSMISSTILICIRPTSLKRAIYI